MSQNSPAIEPDPAYTSQPSDLNDLDAPRTTPKPSLEEDIRRGQNGFINDEITRAKPENKFNGLAKDPHKVNAAQLDKLLDDEAQQRSDRAPHSEPLPGHGG